VVHYEFAVPEEQTGPLTVEVKLQYRKFDTIYMNYVSATNYQKGGEFIVTNDLPIITIASDKITFPVQGGPSAVSKPSTLNPQPSTPPEWQRWNDYGIGLLLEGNTGAEKGELVQAADAFEHVERLGRADGPLNLARVDFKEGRLEEAVAALQRAARCAPPAPRWTVAWLNGLVNKQNGQLDQAISEFRSILDDRYPELDRRGFDFSKDYEVINELGQAYYERAKMERTDPERQKDFLRLAAESFEKTLALDSENLTAHYSLALVYSQLDDQSKAALHRGEHAKYLPDYNAQDRAVATARRADRAADHAAQATVIYSLQRPGAPELSMPEGSHPAGVAENTQ
jgi:tetratricopeptide (TPR) repeat protein